MFSLRQFSLSVVALLALASCSHAKDDALPNDISEKTIAQLRTKLDCAKPANNIAKEGCDILERFLKAEKFNEKTSGKESLEGERWLGYSVVIGGGNKGAGEVIVNNPRRNLVVLGRKYSENFHESIWFGQGMSATYVWPTQKAQITLIDSAAKSLQENRIEHSNPAVKFAGTTEIKFSAVKQSGGISLLIGNESRYLRQQGKMIYLIEESLDEMGENKYSLSKISLDHRL